MNRIRPFFTALTLIALCCSALALPASASARISYGSGEYTNLCGSGTEATHNTCGGSCNTFEGRCSYPQASVVRYVCDGRQTECRQNESDFSLMQSVQGVGCGKTVQIDVFSKQCRSGNGDWTCGDGDLKDYMVWYSGDCSSSERPNPSDPGESCRDYEPINTQFRKANDSTWISGNDITAQNLSQGQKIDVNCFAKNGNDLLPGAKIEITFTNNRTETKHTSVLRNYQLNDYGSYRFRCYSTTLNNCSDSDSLRVQRTQSGSTPTPTPTATPDDHTSQCTDLAITSGDNGTVPATVRFRVTGNDNKGNIQQYRIYFGDGTKEEAAGDEFSHTYESSGTFTARADVKDSRGQWVSSSACETTVRVQARSIESHKSECSNVFVTEGNHRRSPSTVKLKVTGYDNKGGLQRYKLDFGNGVVKESTGQTFEQVYSEPGTYTVRGYVQDSQGDWKGGTKTCETTVYIETAPLTKQPETGMPTAFGIFGITSGFIGSVAFMRARALRG